MRGVPVMECECLTTCPFFHNRMRNMPTTAQLLRRQYCLGDWEACARCMIVRAIGRDAVPDDLYPDQTRRASELIASVHV